jgi:hypothetical protein
MITFVDYSLTSSLEMAKPQVLCLVGMHRSGTSLLASWLNLCGLNLGDNLLDADFSNKKGHFEDVDFLTLHKEVLQLNGFDNSGLQGLENQIKWSPYHEAKRKHLVALKTELRSQWGWKEPRTCLFVDQYKADIPDLKFLVIHRPALEVLQSLLKRDWKRWKAQTAQQAPGGLHYKLLLAAFFRNKLVKERLSAYQTSCEIYFEKIISLLKGDTKNVKAFALNYFLNHDQIVFDHLTKEWAFELDYVPASHVFNPEHLGDGFDFKFELSARLRALDAELNQLTQA